MNRKRALSLYIAGIVTVATLVLVAAIFLTIHSTYSDRPGLLRLMALFTVLCWLGSQRQVLVSESSDHVMGTVAQVAALVTLPVHAAAIPVIACAKILSELTQLARGKRKKFRFSAVNVANTLLSNAAAVAVFTLLGGQHYLWSPGADAIFAIPALIALAAAYQAVDVGVVAGAITLSTREKVLPVFLRLTKDTALPEMSLMLTGLVFALLWRYRPALSLFVILPVVLSIRSFESLARLRRETVDAVVKMAESIDLRDTDTYEHSQRIASMTSRLSRALNLTPEHIGDIVLASKVHDLGKIGISNDILLKQGPLTNEERETMKQHTVIGADILTSYSAFRNSVAIVRHHHERWDGNGYPSGLRGEEIPIGSRIIGVVDAFDAMTADRPYRSGMSTYEAVERLKAGIGSQFDPRICGTFIHMLIEEGVYQPPEQQGSTALHIVPANTRVG
ncbi:MAG: hypothetical protein PVSMB7_09620 [Chloroflexota bacterium]